jgi:serine phosphatase RsbU (regulator of sigma subunit)
MLSERLIYILLPALSLLAAYFLAAISITRKNFKEENLHLALICIWWSLLSWPFIWHNLETDINIIINVERAVHSLYVFVPAISLNFFYVVTESQEKPFLRLCFAISFILMILAQTDYYFYGFRYYQWGMIAKGDWAFDIFAFYGAVVSLYILRMFVVKLRETTNPLKRIKFKYLFISYFISVLITMSNIPAMNGYDFYPLSNLMFIPAGIMTYGVLRYKIIDISRVMEYFSFWFILSSLMVLPNIFIFLKIREIFNYISALELFILFVIWFIVNYFYYNKAQPIVNKIINKRTIELKEKAKELFKNIFSLKGIDELTTELSFKISEALMIQKCKIYTASDDEFRFQKDLGTIEIDKKILQILKTNQELYFQKSAMEIHKKDSDELNSILSLLKQEESEYLIPLENRGEIIALIFLSEKKDMRQFSQPEINFIKNIKVYASVALANSVLYQNIYSIKNNLEKLVEERTSLIEKQKEEIETDLRLARKIQMSLLPKNVPSIKKMKIAYRYEPVSAVGGDFIDVHYRDGMNEVGLFICDVSGHGVTSAMIASMIKISLSSWGKFIKNPSSSFREMREMLKGKIGSNFISAFMCSIDITTGIVTSACAGHHPMIILRKDGDLEYVKPRGKIIIDYVDSEYEELKSKLNYGDKIILYTDGVIETANAEGVILDEEKFKKFLIDNVNLSAYALSSRIHDEIFNNDKKAIIEDDFTLLIAEYTGESL